jgi:hypothetical protein
MENFQLFESEVFRPMTDFNIRPETGPNHISAFDRTDSDDVQSQIGIRLRAVYETVVSEPVPDHFRTLLDNLDCSNERKV